MALTPRGKALRWLTRHRGITEQPAGSNRDNRRDGITAAQKRLAGGDTYLVGAAWCGTWAGNALLAAGVPHVTGRLASVAFIEDDAKAHRGPFVRWTTDPHDWNRGRLQRGDLVVLFGRGVHVGVLREVNLRHGYIVTDEGNTSSGAGGDQANGGGAFRRVRPLSAVHGFAHVNYPN